MAKETISDEQAAILTPSIHKLLDMLGAARDAFNRHSPRRLRELESLQGVVARDLAEAMGQIKSGLARKSEAEQQDSLRLETILNHLAVMARQLAGLADPLHKKIKARVLFSDKAVAQTNNLFDQQAGLVRSLLDIVKTDNQFLKNYLKTEARSLVQACADYATEHQTRLIEGLCAPQAAPIFLAILEALQGMGQTEVEIARLMAEQA